MQVERIKDMAVGDFIQLPAGEWHLNHAAKAMYAEAEEAMKAHQGEGPRPQYQVQYEDKFKSRLERLR
jgi:hypothetical protein